MSFTARRLVFGALRPWYFYLDSAWQGKGAGSFVESLTDLKGSNDLIASGTNPTISADGWQFTGSEWIVTPISPGNETDWTMIVQCNNLDAATPRIPFGGRNLVSGGRSEFGTKSGGAVPASFHAHSGSPTQIGSTLTGTFNFCNAGRSAYLDGIDRGVTLGTVATPNVPDFIIGGYNDFSLGATPSWTSYIVAVGVAFRTLTPAEVLFTAQEMAAL